MSREDLERRLADARVLITALEEELAETNRGLVALIAEVDKKDEQIKATSEQL